MASASKELSKNQNNQGMGMKKESVSSKINEKGHNHIKGGCESKAPALKSHGNNHKLFNATES